MVQAAIDRKLYSGLELKIEEKKGYEFSEYVKELRKGAVEKG